MQKILLFISCLLFSMSIQAFEKKISASQLPDSLKLKLNQAKTIEHKIDAANDICYYLIGNYMNQAEILVKEVLRYADSVKYTRGALDANINLGILFYRKSKYVQSLSCYKEAYSLAEKLNDKGRQAAILNNMALVYTELNYYSKAIELNLQALKLRTKSNDSIAIAMSFNNLGMTYHSKRDFLMANHFYQQALQIVNLTNNKGLKANTYNNLGQLFLEMHSDSIPWAADSALNYFMKAYINYYAIDDQIGVSKTLINIANAYASMQNSDKAIDSYRSALNIQRQLRDSANMALTLYNMGLHFIELNEDKRAYDYLKNSLELAQKTMQKTLERDILQKLFELATKFNLNNDAINYAQLYFIINDSLSEIEHQQLAEAYMGKYNFQLIQTDSISTQLKTYRLITLILSFLMISIILFGIYKIYLLRKS